MPHTFVVGDIHGHLDQLKGLMPQVQEVAEPGDTLVFLGDYIDRGPKSSKVIEAVLMYRDSQWDGLVVTLLGNHEDMLLDSVRWGMETELLYDRHLWLMNGGETTLRSYRCGPEFLDYTREQERTLAFMPEAHLAFMHSLQLHYEDEHAIYVHAGLCPGKRPETCSRFERLWIREDFLNSTYIWEKPVVFGHTPQFTLDTPLWTSKSKSSFKPLNRLEKIGIDTGSCYGGYLTAVMLPDRKFFRSDA